MPSKYPTFDRDRLELLPLADRKNLVTTADVLRLDERPCPYDHADLPALADAVASARRTGAAVILMMGAHVIKQGLSRFIIDLIRRGWVSVIAMNGACAIHDFELAATGATSEDVAENIVQGRFGLWRETGRLNDFVRDGASAGLGFGEAVGKAMCQADLPHRALSIFAAAYECSVPATVHLGIGYDIIHEHPSFDPAAAGAASYRDFLIYTRIVEDLEGGAMLCFGSAVMAPEIYLKALSMARNVACREGRRIRHFTSAVFDLVRLSGDLTAEAPKDTPAYYYRPFKTILVRTVRDGGRSFYIQGDHRATIPALHAALSSARA